MPRNPILRVLAFSGRLARRSRRTKVFAAIALLPVLLAVLLQVNRLASPGRGQFGLEVFANIIMGFGLQFLVLLLSLFFGTSIVADETENRTLTYLTTRPIPKTAIVLGKYGAVTLLLLALVLSSVVISFLVLNFDRLGDGKALEFLGRSLAALTLGTVCYTALFTLVGAVLKKAVLFGLFFGFGWEAVVQYFPGSTQRFTIMHYLKSLLPAAGESGGKLSFLMFRLQPSPAGTAVMTLLVLTAVFLGLACWAFARKEYLFDE
jgi:ABC-type transport system involved in multi-copper enzyme maturation permease subunit